MPLDRFDQGCFFTAYISSCSHTDFNIEISQYAFGFRLVYGLVKLFYHIGVLAPTVDVALL